MNFNSFGDGEGDGFIRSVNDADKDGIGLVWHIGCFFWRCFASDYSDGSVAGFSHLFAS